METILYQKNMRQIKNCLKKNKADQDYRMDAAGQYNYIMIKNS